MQRCVIIGAGELDGEPRRYEGDVFVAADGGYDHMKKLGIEPDALVGDFDSISEMPRGYLSKIRRFPKKKDETDTYLAYEYGKEMGCDAFYIYGGTGGREDHTFANYSLLIRAKNERTDAYLMTDGWRIYAAKNETVRLYRDEGKRVSVFAFGGAARISIRGLEYECENLTITPDYPIGVSNTYARDMFPEISVEDGTVLIFEEL